MAYLPLKKTKSQAIILIHGMGEHSAPEEIDAGNGGPASFKPGSFGREFIDTSATLMKDYAAYDGKSLADFFDIHEVNYNQWFDKMRATLADNAKSMSDRLAALGGLYGTNFPFEMVQKLTNFEAGFGQDKFFYTHWLDVLFYGSMLGAKVRADAAAVICDAIAQYDAANVHIVAHSLGTAVTHDTLHALYGATEVDPEMKAKGATHLDLVEHQLRSVWMFANVSRLVNAVTRFSEPLKSVVRPDDGGCVSTFINVRHELDPFTMLARFDPVNDGSWVSAETYESLYNCLTTKLVVEPNTHSFPQYLQDPRVAAPMLKFFLFPNFQGTPAEIEAAKKKRSDEALLKPLLYEQLKTSLETARKTDSLADWGAFLDNAKLFADAIAKLGGKFKT